MAEPLIGSLLYYGIIFAVCELGRRIIGDAQIRNSRQLFLSFTMEVLATLQVCSMAFENGVVLRNYGLAGFFLVIAASVILHTVSVRGAYATPCPIFEQSISALAAGRSRSIFTGDQMIRLIGQLIGAVLAFRLARLVWTAGLIDEHKSLAAAYPCSSDLNVSLEAGIFLEMSATFACRLLWLLVRRKGDNRWAMWMDAVVVPTIVVLGFTTTGMYFNPILAFSLNYGCKGVRPIQHLLVYWLGPTIGWILATQAHKRVF